MPSTKRKLTVYVTEGELAAIRRAAAAFDMELSEYMREAARMKARDKGIQIPDDMPRRGEHERIPPKN